MEKKKKELETGTWFHSYLLIGDKSEKLQEAVDLLILKTGSIPEDIITLIPDESSGKSGEIKIEQVKTFAHDLNLTPNGNVRIGIIYGVERLNSSSANALLKLLEEPPRSAVIILVSVNDSSLQTIKSRCRTYKVGQEVRESGNTFSYDHLLKDTLSKSFKSIEQLVKNDETEDLLDSLERYYESKMIETLNREVAEYLKLLLKIRNQIKGNANQRLAIENLILKARKL